MIINLSSRRFAVVSATEPGYSDLTLDECQSPFLSEACPPLP